MIRCEECKYFAEKFDIDDFGDFFDFCECMVQCTPLDVTVRDECEDFEKA